MPSDNQPYYYILQIGIEYWNSIDCLVILLILPNYWYSVV